MASMKINVLLFCCLVGLSATAEESDGFELVKKPISTTKLLEVVADNINVKE